MAHEYKAQQHLVPILSDAETAFPRSSGWWMENYKRSAFWLPWPGFQIITRFIHLLRHLAIADVENPINKTQWQLCKRLAEAIIPLSWACLVCKKVPHMEAITGDSQQPLFLMPFLASWQPNKQLGDPGAILLLTSEKAVFCNYNHIWFN